MSEHGVDVDGLRALVKRLRSEGGRRWVPAGIEACLPPLYKDPPLHPGMVVADAANHARWWIYLPPDGLPPGGTGNLFIGAGRWWRDRRDLPLPGMLVAGFIAADGRFRPFDDGDPA
jgi:hypothetical protein